MTEQPTTGGLEYYIRRFASDENIPGGDDLVRALEEAMRLIADLQARVTALEGDTPGTGDLFIDEWDEDEDE